MSWFHTIRARLLLWYFFSLIPLLGFLAAGSWYASKRSIYRAIDRALSYRIEGVIELLHGYTGSDPTALAKRLDEGASLMAGGGVFWVFDNQLHLLYKSPALLRHKVGVNVPRIVGSQVAYRNFEDPHWKLRTAAKRINLDGREWVVEVGDPLVVYESALGQYEGMVLLSMPILVILAGFAGNYIGRRALEPVDRITTSARTITARNLSERLSVPKTGDELHRLSETLNGMLDRIESSFNRNRQFTADASHELRAPLTLIQSAAEHALRRDRDRSELLQVLREILQEARRTVRMLNHLLTLARSDANVKMFKPAVVDLKSTLEDMQPNIESMVAAKNQSIRFDMPPETVKVMGDYDSLRRLVLILIDNAVKYTPEDGSVFISLHLEDGAALLTVRDTGIGLSPEDVPHLFDRFWRGDKVRSREFGGSGLGLSIARVIADQHEAGISVESALERGATFTVKFPLYQETTQLTA